MYNKNNDIFHKIIKDIISPSNYNILKNNTVENLAEGLKNENKYFGKNFNNLNNPKSGNTGERLEIPQEDYDIPYPNANNSLAPNVLGCNNNSTTSSIKLNNKIVNSSITKSIQQKNNINSQSLNEKLDSTIKILSSSEENNFGSSIMPYDCGNKLSRLIPIKTNANQEPYLSKSFSVKNY